MSANPPPQLPSPYAVADMDITMAADVVDVPLDRVVNFIHDGSADHLDMAGSTQAMHDELRDVLEDIRRELTWTDDGAPERVVDHIAEEESVSSEENVDDDDETIDAFRQWAFDVLTKLRDMSPGRPQAVNSLLTEILFKKVLRDYGRSMYNDLGKPENPTGADLTVDVCESEFRVHRTLFQTLCPTVEIADGQTYIRLYLNPSVFRILHVYMYTGSRQAVSTLLWDLVEEHSIKSRKLILGDFIYMIGAICLGTEWQLRELADVVWDVLVHTE